MVKNDNFDYFIFTKITTFLTNSIDFLCYISYKIEIMTKISLFSEFLVLKMMKND